MKRAFPEASLLETVAPGGAARAPPQPGARLSACPVNEHPAAVRRITCCARQGDIGPADIHRLPASLGLQRTHPVGKSLLVSLVGHRSEEHTSELQSRGHLVCRLLLEKKKRQKRTMLK